jgi:hypothetical protein
MTHDQVRQLVRRINPIQDPSMLETVDVSVLDLERSIDMQVDERPMADERRNDRWRPTLIGIAAAAVVLIGGWVFINTGEDDVATPAPNAIALDTIEMDQPLAPGAYFANTDANQTPQEDDVSSIRGTFVIEGAGWTAIQAHGALKEDGVGYVSLMIVEVDEVYTTVCEMSGRAPIAAESTVAGLADQFASNGFIVLEPVTPVSAFGYEGLKLVMAVPAGCADGLDQAWNGGLFQGRYYQGDGQVLEYYFLDVEGTSVMVEASWFPGSSDEDIAELRDVLDTLVITP